MNGSDLTKKVIERIEELGGVAFNIVTAGKAGTPDVLAVLNGNFYGLEVKGDGDKESEAQTLVILKIIKAGGKARYVRSLDDLEDVILNKPLRSQPPELKHFEL